MAEDSNSELPAGIEDIITAENTDSSVSSNNVQTKADEPNSKVANLTIKEKNEIAEKAKLLQELLAMESKIHYCAAKDIVILSAFISRNGVSIIKQGTINLLQGKSGTHKSRLCELLISLLIDKTGNNNYLDFQKEIDTPVVVCYIDTERNTTEELPQSIQNVKLKAGYSKDEKTANFRFTSIKQVDRSNRLKAVEQFTSEVRSQNQNTALFIVLDVATDCCANFNNPEESLRLFDFVGALCEKYNATFLLVVHENPFSDKARGHLGTEATNKSSTVLSIGFEKVDNKEIDLIHLNFVKLRGAKRPPPMYFKYNEEAGELEMASNDLISKMLAEKEQMTDVNSVAQSLEEIMVEDREYSQKEILTALSATYKWSVNTLKVRLKTISESKRQIMNPNSEPCTLESKSSNGKETIYRLVIVSSEDFETEVMITE